MVERYNANLLNNDKLNESRNDSQMIPYRRLTVEKIQEKVSEINLLIEL